MLEHLITFKFGSDFTRSGDEMLYHCPFCEELGKRNNDRKLYVNSKSGRFHCFRCDTSGSVSKNLNLSSDVFTKSKDMFEEMVSFISGNGSNPGCINDLYFNIPNKLLVDYPDTVPFNYMIDRGITPDMMRKYSMRVFGEGKLFHNRVVIPNRIINNNWTDFYTCRAVLDSMCPRYLNSKFSNKTDIVFNIQNIPIGGDIIINEGCINSIIAGSNSIAILGKFASNSQINQIVMKNPKRIYISLDYDARDNALRLADKLHMRLPSCEIRLVDLPKDQDASDLGKLNYLGLVEDSKVLYYRSDDILHIFENFALNLAK